MYRCKARPFSGVCLCEYLQDLFRVANFAMNSYSQASFQSQHVSSSYGPFEIRQSKQRTCQDSCNPSSSTHLYPENSLHEMESKDIGLKNVNILCNSPSVSSEHFPTIACDEKCNCRRSELEFCIVDIALMLTYIPIVHSKSGLSFSDGVFVLNECDDERNFSSM